MSSNNQDNHNNNEQDNIVPFKAPRTKKDDMHHKPQEGASITQNEPFIKMPPFTKYLLGILISIHLGITFLLNNEQFDWIALNLGFIPGRFSGTAPFDSLSLITPFTHMFIHGGWIHLGMNAVMLLAFGSGIERWMGGKKMAAFFIASGLCGVALHFALNMHSISPLIGASGGISGLFAAALVMLNKQHGAMTGRFGLWPIAIIWVVISVLFGFVDAPQIGIQKEEIAWAAHVGGFIGGFGLLKMMKII